MNNTKRWASHRRRGLQIVATLALVGAAEADARMPLDADHRAAVPAQVVAERRHGALDPVATRLSNARGEPLAAPSSGRPAGPGADERPVYIADAGEARRPGGVEERRDAGVRKDEPKPDLPSALVATALLCAFALSRRVS